MKFIDQTVIVAASGAGGHGCVHFHREKFIPRGGPDGGDGGKGGDVVLVADNRSRSLLDYHHRRTYAAGDGTPGSSARKSGRDGEDLVLAVPPGTQVFDDDTGELLADLTEPDQRVRLLRGGNGGWGNVHFATATRQAPDRANPGQPGERRTLRMELKLLADVALVGLPNAGKSSLIRTISASKAVVADYPFTTLQPNLGVVRYNGRTFTVADIPGLIEGAAEGAGLGTRFLRHVERCRLLVFLLSPVDEVPPPRALEILRGELGRYDPTLLERPSVVVLGKADTLGDEAPSAARALSRQLDEPVLTFSAVTAAGREALLDRLADAFPPEAPPQPQGSWDPLA